MKAVQTKTAATPAKKNTPFFNKESGNDFFASSKNEQPFFSHKNSFFKTNSYPLQTKLTIGKPNDIYEKEADAMADKVVQRLSIDKTDISGKSGKPVQKRSTEPLSTFITGVKGVIQTKCAACEKEKLQKKEGDGQQLLESKLQKKPVFESNAEPPDDDKNIQRKCAECEKADEKKLQRKCDACEKEDKLLHKKEDGKSKMNGRVQTKSIFESNEEKNIQRKCVECEKEKNKSLQRKYDACEKEDAKNEMNDRVQKKSIFESNEEKNNIQRKCAKCEKENKLQKKSTNVAKAEPADIESSLNATRNSGNALPQQVRSQMENSFGANFSNVRIHNDSTANRMSRDLHAHAFTHSNHIYFNTGKYNTTSTSGKHLLAHELTHTVQQNAVTGLARKTIVQALCDHSHCSGDPATPSCPNPAEFITNENLKGIRLSVFQSVKHPAVLKKGDVNAAVVLIKKLVLNTHCEGYDRLAVETEPEPEFGNNTKEAIKFFQLNHKDSNGEPLLQDGIIGPATLGAMDAEIGLSVTPLPKKAEGKGTCLGVAEQGPGLTKKWDTNSADYLKFPPFFPAVQAWEISNFDIAKFFLKTEHREFLRTTVVPEIKDAIAKSKTKLKVRIIGEASTTASNAFNMTLSHNRANCLRKTLIEFGLDAAAIESPVTFLGEELAKFMPILKGQSLFPVDNVEDLTERRVTIVLQGDEKDCDKTKASTVFYAYIACHTPNTYLVNIMDLSDNAMPMYREFVWGHDDDTKGCDFKPGFGPLSVFKIEANAPLQLAKTDPDNPIADSDFIGPTLHFYDDRGMTIQKEGVVPAYILPVPGDWIPPHCETQHIFMTGELNPIGPVKCGMMPVPPASDKCKEDEGEDCPPDRRQRPAKKFVATMKWLSADVIKLLKKIPWVKKVTKKIDDILDFFGIDINTSVTAAYIKIGTTDEKDKPITRKFYFIGGEITGSSLPLFDADSVYAEEFILDTPKQLEKVAGDSDFSDFTDLIIKGGTNHVELHITGIDKPIVFKSFFCDTGGDKKSKGYLKTGELSCSQLDTVKRGDKTCKEPEEDCPDSQKLKEDDKFLVKIGRATIADLPVAGKKLADKLGCGVTAAFINIGSMSGDEKKRIYRKFIFVGKNVDCRYIVEKGSENKDFLISRKLTYPDPNDTFALSDFSGGGSLDKSGDLLIVSPKNLPLHIQMPGMFDGACQDAKSIGFVIPVSAVDCGMVPDPMHSTTPDITDLNRCEEFKKKNIALITDALSDLKGKYSKIVDSITDPPRLIYPLYNNLFYDVGRSLSNAVFFGKNFEGQSIVTVVDMQVISVFADPTYGYLFTVKFLSDPCSYNEAGEPVFILPKNCREAYITKEGEYIIYPLPDIDNKTDEDQTKQDDTPTESKKPDDECHADCHALGIIPGMEAPSQKLKLNLGPLSPESPKCGGCHEDVQRKEESVENPVQNKSHKEIGFESNQNLLLDKHLQKRCDACEKEEKKKVQRKCDECEKEEQEKLQKKENSVSEQPSSANIENTLSASKGSGFSLPKNVLHQMESSFDTDFSDVRIHNDTKANNMSKDLNAQAFTHDNDIYFNAGKFDTNSSTGKHLLAHELTHVVQQNGAKEITAVQKNTADDHNLQSENFRGDEILESCFDGESEHFLKIGKTGEPVVKLQEALLQLGFELPQFGADGIFKQETDKAVRNFQTKENLSIDGVVGPFTIGKWIHCCPL
ncbi:MAG: DUF4157 domain-containing protein [Agriterribacter sp.]